MTQLTEASLGSALEQTLKDIGIPPRPAILERISAEMQKDEPNFKQLALLIGVDVSLAASLIKTANSPYYGFRTKARSADEALMMLGLDATSRAIAGISLRKAFPTSPLLERFWDASSRIAVLSAWLVGQLGKKSVHPADAHTYGLFRDCGIPVMLLRFPEYAKTLANANQEADASFTEVETRDFPTDHAMIGCLLAQNWWLPQELCLAIRHHHDLAAIDLMESGLPAASRYMIAISQTAECILQQATGLSSTREWPKLGHSCLRLLNLTMDEVTDLQALAADVLTASV